MAKSIQEQLLQAGLAKPKQAKKARREKAVSEKAARKQGGQTAEQRELQQQVARAQAEKQARDRQLNAAQKAEREAREVAYSAAQIISRNRIECDAGENAASYSYTIDKKIHSITVSESQRKDLAAGRLAIARLNASASLLPRPVAQRLMEKIPECVWMVSADTSEASGDDPYADYPIPDDLIW